MTTLSITEGTYTTLTVTNLQSLANDATDPFAGWQSARVVTSGSPDFEIYVSLTTANTAPANEQAATVYVIPWITTDGGTTWLPGANFGTTTAPTGTEGTASMSEPNSMRVITLPYKIAQQVMTGMFTLSNVFGQFIPEAWSLAIRNASGAALSTGCVVAYRSITDSYA